ncbi:SPASM domain-containing protein, partial [Vibrio parahaemolyticus]|nr:SPASM domain-containing protein [Vibrio parahaemolyticus]
VVTTDLKEIKDDNKNVFNKESRLSQRCTNCQFLQLCNGGCPKHRYLSDSGEYENVLCDGYYFFFNSIHKYLQAMTTLLANGYPASYVMQALNGPLILTTSK